MYMEKTRKNLSAEGLIKTIYNQFKKIKDPKNINGKISLTDCLMSCLAIFSLKYFSLLSFEIEKKLPKATSNLKNLYLVKNPPSDTYMRRKARSFRSQNIKTCF